MTRHPIIIEPAALVYISADEKDVAGKLKAAFAQKPNVVICVEAKPLPPEQKAAWQATTDALWAEVAAKFTEPSHMMVFATANANPPPEQLLKRIETPILFKPLSEEVRDEIREEIREELRARRADKSAPKP